MIWLMIACESSYGIKEHNSAPTVNIYSHESGMELTVGATEVFLANVVDLNDPLSSLEIEWYYGENRICTETYIDENNDTFCELVITPSQDFVRVVVRDSSNAVGDDRVDFTVFQNSLPSAPLIEISPENPTSIDDVTALATATDPNGDVLNYRYSWHLEGDANNVVSSTNQLSSDFTSRGQVWVVTADALDDYGAGPSSSLQFEVLNGPPVIDSVVITPSTNVYNDSTLLCSATASDPDSESEVVILDYVWKYDGQTIGSSAEITLDPQVVSPQDQVICMVTATDIEVATASAQAVVSLDNRPISIVDYGLDPLNPTVSDTLQFWADVDDPDQQEPSINYAWSINGQSISNPAETLSNQFVKYDNIEVVATISDGIDSQQVSATTIIQNSSPTAPGVSISPSSPIEGDTLLCDLDAPSSDADGDVLSYLVTWTKNGSTYSGTTSTTNLTDDTIPGGQVHYNDNWSCEIFVDDGAATVSSGTQQFNTVNGWCTVTIPQTCYNSTTTTHFGRHASCGVNPGCTWCCQQDYIDPDCEGWCTGNCPNWHADYYNECTYTETTQTPYNCDYTVTQLCN